MKLEHFVRETLTLFLCYAKPILRKKTPTFAVLRFEHVNWKKCHMITNCNKITAQWNPFHSITKLYE